MKLSIKKLSNDALKRVYAHIDAMVHGAKVATGKRVAKARRELELKYGKLT